MRISVLRGHTVRFAALSGLCLASFALAFFAVAQQPIPADPAQFPAQQPPVQPASAATPAQIHPLFAGPQSSDDSRHGINEEFLRQQLVGKALYLRGGYLDNSLSFDEHGHIIGNPAQASYTLSAVQIDKVRLTKHKVELYGARYGLHFLGQLAMEDTSFDRVRITPKDRRLRITIDREIVLKTHKKKEKKSKTPEPPEPSDADQLKAYIAAAPEAERPADAASVTVTTSPAHAANLLKQALADIFAPGLDDRMIASMPDFWRLYYQAAAQKADYRPTDPAVLRPSAADQKPQLLTTFAPDSNEFAQSNGVAGMALYHTVVGIDGKAAEIAVGRPIGFGLDENAVAAIRKASFRPGLKGGQPVPVLIDLVVQFRIFSNRTAAPGQPVDSTEPQQPILPGPYSLARP